MKIAIVGSYGRDVKRALTDLLFAPDADVGIKSYRSVNTMLNDWRRPDFNLIALMAGVPCENLSALRKTLGTPVLYLTLGGKQTEVHIESHIAIVKLSDGSVARDQRVKFAMAASRRVYGEPQGKHWPIELVPSEYLQPAPHPRR